MGHFQKVRESILSGMQDNNISFSDLTGLLAYLNFSLRIKGDHHILSRSDIEEIINLQPKGSKAKPYQVKQVRNLILKYKLGGES